MTSKQIRIERKTLTKKSAIQNRRDAEIDLRSPSGKKLPY